MRRKTSTIDRNSSVLALAVLGGLTLLAQAPSARAYHLSHYKSRQTSTLLNGSFRYQLRPAVIPGWPNEIQAHPRASRAGGGALS